MKKTSTLIKIVPLAGLALFALVVAARLLVAKVQVQNELQTLQAVEPFSLGETSTLEILPLYEGNTSRPDFQSGLGVSYLVKTDTVTILFDVGHNPEQTSPSPLEQNMAALGVSLDDVDMIVISHIHYDHLGGKGWQKQGTFGIGWAAQVPLGSRPVYVPENLMYPDSTPEIIRSQRKIAEGVATTGAIPYIYPFPAWLAIPSGVEQALVVNVRDKGLVVITGCGHMRLDSLLKHAQADFVTLVVGIVGGLHERNAGSKALQPEIKLLRDLDPILVAVSPHDTATRGLMVFEQAFPAVYQTIEVGKWLYIP